jgi:hypothetical protein
LIYSVIASEDDFGLFQDGEFSEYRFLDDEDGAEMWAKIPTLLEAAIANRGTRRSSSNPKSDFLKRKYKPLRIKSVRAPTWQPPQARDGLDALFWRFVYERMVTFWHQANGDPQPWSQYPQLTNYKFTNVYFPRSAHAGRPGPRRPSRPQRRPAHGLGSRQRAPAALIRVRGKRRRSNRVRAMTTDRDRATAVARNMLAAAQTKGNYTGSDLVVLAAEYLRLLNDNEILQRHLEAIEDRAA